MEEKFITVKELLEVIESNYYKNIYTDNMKRFIGHFSSVMLYFNMKEINIKGNQCLEFEMGNDSTKLVLCKSNDQIFIISSMMTLKREKTLLEEINFNEIYDYFIQNKVTEKVKMETFYDGEENDRRTFLLTFDYKSLYLQNKRYYIKYEMNNDNESNLYVSEQLEKGDYESCFELKSLFATVPDFLSKLKIDFNKLPKYIQEEYNKNCLPNDKSILHIPVNIDTAKRIDEILKKEEILIPEETSKKKKILGLFEGKKSNN